MNANELMKGDWVRHVKEYGNPQDEITKVDALDLYEISQGLYEVEPIPLTAEILEKNDWKIDGDCYGDIWQMTWLGEPFELKKKGDVYDIQKSFPHLSPSSTFPRMEFTLCSIRYVHELQHALRLCGIEKEIEL